MPPKDIDPAAQRAIGKTIESAIFRIVAGLNGSFSAEHGIGRTKRDRFAATGNPVQLDLLATLKAAIDPVGLMNPGCLIKPRESAQ